MSHLVLESPDDARAVAADDEYLFGPDLLVAPVTAPSTERRSVYLPDGHQWIDLWRSASADRDGSLLLGDATVRRGGRTHRVDAPRDEIPLHVRGGAVIPLLPPDVETLASYGSDEVVRLADRDDRRRLLAFPGPDWEGALGPGETISSRVEGGEWTMELRATRARTYDLQASTVLLERLGSSPCELVVDGRTAEFRFDASAQVITASLRLGPKSTVTANAC